jgi:hypothetical protein
MKEVNVWDMLVTLSVAYAEVFLYNESISGSGE